MSRLSAAQAVSRDQSRMVALDRLLVVIADHVEHGETVPCVQPARGHWWLSRDSEEREAAARLCGGCPALHACRAYITNHPEPAGIWAGVDVETKPHGSLPRPPPCAH